VTHPQITPEIQRLVAEHIDAADQLDILLLLHSAPDRAWTAREVSESVFTVPTAATMRLEQLVQAGFLASTGGADPSYTYRPATPGLGDQVDALAAVYRANRVGVIQLVFQKAADPLKSFSNAFRLRRDD
jgi:hypothetical protein